MGVSSTAAVKGFASCEKDAPNTFTDGCTPAANAKPHSLKTLYQLPYFTQVIPLSLNLLTKIME